MNTQKLWNVAMRVASERDSDTGDLQCTCCYQMGGVKLFCIYCEAREAIEPRKPMKEPIIVKQVPR
jgi:hypothetical protein